MSDAALRSAYLVSRYPAVTHAFIQREVGDLRAAGAELHTVSVRRQRPEEILSPEDEREFRTTHALVPATPGQLVAAHARAFRAAPRGYVRTLVQALRLSAGGARALVWQLFYFAEAGLLVEWMRARDLRHVHVHFANPAADVALLAVRLGNAGNPDRWSWSLTVHGPTELNDMEGHKLALKAREAVVVVCTSDYARSQVAIAAPDQWDKLRTVRCGVDVDAFSPDGDAPARTGPLRLLNVAAPSARKGQAVLLEAIGELQRRGVDVRLTLVGDGPERSRLEARAAELGVADRVVFAGAVPHDEIGERFRAADVFCLPSFAEGVPTVLLEAMATGVPVVATYIAGVPELVEHGKSGFLVPAGRSDLLADAVERLAADPQLRVDMGRAARERVTADYEAGHAAAELLRVLAAAVGQTPP